MTSPRAPRDRERPPLAPPLRCPAAPISAGLFIPNERCYQLRDPGPLVGGDRPVPAQEPAAAADGAAGLPVPAATRTTNR